MVDFIIQNWIELFFTLLGSGVIYFGKKYISLIEKERKKEQEAFHQMMKEEIASGYIKSQEDDIVLQKEIESLQKQMLILKNGVLSLQGRDFKNECRELLTEGREITLEEYEQICTEHEVYNKLGGNHKGDELFKLVRDKFKSTIV